MPEMLIVSWLTQFCLCFVSTELSRTHRDYVSRQVRLSPTVQGTARSRSRRLGTVPPGGSPSIVVQHCGHARQKGTEIPSTTVIQGLHDVVTLTYMHNVCWYFYQKVKNKYNYTKLQYVETCHQKLMLVIRSLTFVAVDKVTDSSKSSFDRIYS